MKVGDLVKVTVHHGYNECDGQLGIIVEIEDDNNLDGYVVHGTMLLSGAKKWFDLDELELVE
jgi:hypothetical protein